MVLIILPEMPRWGISYSQLLGAPGPSSSHEGGLRALFYSAVEVAGMADHTGPRVWISPFFQRPVQHDFPSKRRFLGRPRLLTGI
jgi:hypothetical protein